MAMLVAGGRCRRHWGIGCRGCDCRVVANPPALVANAWRLAVPENDGGVLCRVALVDVDAELRGDGTFEGAVRCNEPALARASVCDVLDDARPGRRRVVLDVQNEPGAPVLDAAELVELPLLRGAPAEGANDNRDARLVRLLEDLHAHSELGRDVKVLQLVVARCDDVEPALCRLGHRHEAEAASAAPAGCHRRARPRRRQRRLAVLREGVVERHLGDHPLEAVLLRDLCEQVNRDPLWGRL